MRSGDMRNLTIKDTLIKLGKESGEVIQYYVLKDMVVIIKKL